MAKIISIHSCRAGTGQSNLLANLALSVAQLGYRVGILDPDGQAPGIHAVFGVDNDRIDQDWNNDLQDNGSITADLLETKLFLPYDRGHIALMGGGVRLPNCHVQAKDIARLLHQGYCIDRLNQGFLQLAQRLHLDYLLIDTPPGLGEETLFFLGLSNILLLILRLNQQDFQGLAVTVDIAHKLGIPKILLVANQVQTTLDPATIQQQLEQTYQEAVAGVLPFCEDMLLLASNGLFCLKYPAHPLTLKIQTIAQNLIDLELPSRAIAPTSCKTSATGTMAQKPGLNMAELVNLPVAQRQLASWMMRKGPITLAEAAKHINQAEVDVQTTLGILIEQGFVEASTHADETYYQIRIAPKRGSSIGKNLWDL